MRAPAVLAALIGLTLAGCGASANQAAATPPASSSATPQPSPSQSPAPDWATGTPLPTPPAVSAASYKAGAKNIPYRELERDADILAGTIVVFKGQVIQYDTATTRSHMRIDVTPDGYGGYYDTVWLDVDQAVTAKIFNDSVIRFWGKVVGSYTYETVNNGHVTIPEVDAKYVQVLRS